MLQNLYFSYLPGMQVVYFLRDIVYVIYGLPVFVVFLLITL